MTFSASSHTTAGTPEGLRKRFHFFGLLPGLLAALIGLAGLLALLPDGLADSAQTLLGWLVVGLVAAIAVTALVMGLERLQDCEGG